VVLPRLVPDPVWAGVLIVSWNLAVGLGAAWILAARLTQPLRTLAAATSQISRGDLRVELATAADDETGELARSFSSMLDEMLGVLVEVQATAERIAESTHSLSATSERMHTATADVAGAMRAMAHGAEVQAHQIQLTSGAMRELQASGRWPTAPCRAAAGRPRCWHLGLGGRAPRRGAGPLGGPSAPPRPGWRVPPARRHRAAHHRHLLGVAADAPAGHQRHH
jgi:HAMP domain-containing protein